MLHVTAYALCVIVNEICFVIDKTGMLMWTPLYLSYLYLSRNGKDQLWFV